MRQQRLEQLALIRRQDDGLIVDKERVGLPVEQEIRALEQIRPPLIALEDVSDARQQPLLSIGLGEIFVRAELEIGGEREQLPGHVGKVRDLRDGVVCAAQHIRKFLAHERLIFHDGDVLHRAAPFLRYSSRSGAIRVSRYLLLERLTAAM